MKKIPYLLTVLFALLFIACDDTDDVVCHFNSPYAVETSIKNNAAEQKETELILLGKDESGQWKKESTDKNSVDAQGTLKLNGVFEASIYNTETRACTFALRVGDSWYLGFSKSEPSDAGIPESSVKKENLHIVKMYANEALPAFEGSLQTDNKTGVSEDKSYNSVTEHFSVTIDADDVSFSLDSVEF